MFTSYAILLLSQKRLPDNFFIYIFVVAFFGADLAVAVSTSGQFMRINDFPTPSGWIVHKHVFENHSFDESFRYHVDTEFLGYVNSSRFQRVHQVEAGVLLNVERVIKQRPFLKHVSQHSVISETLSTEPLVTRFNNPNGGMGTIARDRAVKLISQQEHAEMYRRYKMVPW